MKGGGADGVETCAEESPSLVVSAALPFAPTPDIWTRWAVCPSTAALSKGEVGDLVSGPGCLRTASRNEFEEIIAISAEGLSSLESQAQPFLLVEVYLLVSEKSSVGLPSRTHNPRSQS